MKGRCCKRAREVMMMSWPGRQVTHSQTLKFPLSWKEQQVKSHTSCWAQFTCHALKHRENTPPSVFRVVFLWFYGQMFHKHTDYSDNNEVQLPLFKVVPCNLLPFSLAKTGKVDTSTHPENSSKTRLLTAHQPTNGARTKQVSIISHQITDSNLM